MARGPNTGLPGLQGAFNAPSGFEIPQDDIQATLGAVNDFSAAARSSVQTAGLGSAIDRAYSGLRDRWNSVTDNGLSRIAQGIAPSSEAVEEANRAYARPQGFADPFSPAAEAHQAQTTFRSITELLLASFYGGTVQNHVRWEHGVFIDEQAPARIQAHTIRTAPAVSGTRVELGELNENAVAMLRGVQASARANALDITDPSGNIAERLMDRDTLNPATQPPFTVDPAIPTAG